MTETTALRAEISDLFRQDVDELNSLLGQSDPDAEDTLHSFESAKLWGEGVMSELSATLKSAICEDWQYCKRRQSKNFDDDVTLAVQIAEIIVKGIGSHPVGIIATILVKRGLDSFCDCGHA